MEDELELKENISRMPDEKLLEMVAAKPGEYRASALYFAQHELKARGIDFNTEPEASDDTDLPLQLADPLSLHTASQPGICPLCQVPLRAGTLVAEKELTIVFKDNREERFVIVTACPKCGQVNLTVDNDTAVE